MSQKDSNIQPLPITNDTSNHEGSHLPQVTLSGKSRALPVPPSLSPWVLPLVLILGPS